MTAICRAVGLFIMLSTSAWAEDPFQDGAPCDDLWFSRNAMLDKAGYCFASPLGQAVFDNSDCQSNAVGIDALTQTAIDLIKAREEFFQCNVDTSRTALDLDPQDMARRRVLDIQPVEETLWQFEHSCVGYVGDLAPIHSAPISTAPTIGTVQPGALLNFNRGTWMEDARGNAIDADPIEPAFPEWIFAEVLGSADQHVAGWIERPQGALKLAEFGGICEGVAG